MTMRGKRWLEQHQRIVDKKPWIRLDSFNIESLGPDCGYEVTINGFNLRRSIFPILITVDGTPLEKLEFQEDGRMLKGILQKKPCEQNIIVDLGFARAELGEMESQTGQEASV